MRALRWGWELLGDIQQDATVPVESRDGARALALRYPAPAMLQKLLASGARQLPQEVGAAIDDARTLFEELQVRRRGAADTQRCVLYTLRHFPLYDAVARVNDCLGGLQDWLQPEDLTTSPKGSVRISVFEADC
jgi:hypothetical protein